MGKDTAIEWTHHTFNPWRGCTKVSDGCKFCYAEKMSHRNPTVLGEWGNQGKRVIAAESYWKQPESWDRAAQKAGEQRTVFCSSMADPFEDREDLLDARRDLFRIVERCRNLLWLFLTKRPQNALRLIEQATGRHADAWLADCHHVWVGASVENQEAANERIPHLLSIPAAMRFLSCEPLLGPLDISHWLGDNYSAMFGGFDLGIRWVIVGGESGPNARPMHPNWVRSLRDQCHEVKVPFFFKQWGEWLPWEHLTGEHYTAQNTEMATMRGDNLEEMESVRLLADPQTRSSLLYVENVGKKKAGRLLDGRTWNETP